MTHSNDTTPGASASARPGQLSLREFIPLLAMIQALDALSIDAMMPALAEIGRDLRVANANDVQLVVTVLMLGITLGQLIGGPLSDSFGRKRTVYIGLCLYIVGSLIGALAPEPRGHDRRAHPSGHRRGHSGGGLHGAHPRSL